MLLCLAASPVLPLRLAGAGGTNCVPPAPTPALPRHRFFPFDFGVKGSGRGGDGTDIAAVLVPAGMGLLWGAKALPGLGCAAGERSRAGSRRCGQRGMVQFLPSVLVPRFHLRVGEVEGGGQFHPVLHAQVFLPLEAALQLGQLMVGEGGAGFARLFQPHRGTVPGTGDLSVPFFFH